MANTSYPKGMEKVLGGTISFSGDTFKVALLPSTYTYSTAHEFLADVGARIGTDQTLTGVSIVGGVLDANDPDFGALAPGDTIKAVVVYKSTGSDATSPLLLYYDIVTGLPMATNGGNVTIPWDAGPKKIARLNTPFTSKGAEKVFAGGINFAADTLKVALLSDAYVANASHEFLPDFGTLIGVDQVLSGKSVVGGVFDANDADFGALAAGSNIGSAILYKDTGTPATSPVLMRFADIVGFPMATNGGGVQLQWSNGAAKIVGLVPA